MAAKKKVRVEPNPKKGAIDADEREFTAHFRVEEERNWEEAMHMLLKAGLAPIVVTLSGSIVVTASRQSIEELVPVRLKVKDEHLYVNRQRRSMVRRSYDIDTTEPVPLGLSSLGKFYFPVPFHYWQESAYPPRVRYYHLHASRDLPRIFGVEGLHARGVRGQGCRVVMVDTGFYRHPYYTDASIHSWAVPNVTTHSVLPTSDPDMDEYGHGTAIAANVFAIAPECEFHHIKDDDDPLAALALARDLNPDVLSISWGWFETYIQDQFDNLPEHGATLYLREVETEINGMVENGTVVFCASGNNDLPGNWPSSMPKVISVGGAFIDEHLNLTASSYATSFTSRIYTADNNEPRRCPDVCGLVGPEPRGLLLAMPTQPRNILDADFSRDDGTRPGDGWLIGSGTSSATPQVAAMAALLLQLYGPMSPADVRQRLEQMAVGVHHGYTATGHRAWENRPNIATGYGFVTLRRPQLYGGYTGLY